MNALDKITDPNCSVTTHDIEAARAELAALRAKAEAYDEVMRRITEAKETYGVLGLGSRVCVILDEERKAGRYVP